jgi:hypothetical protein
LPFPPPTAANTQILLQIGWRLKIIRNQEAPWNRFRFA